MDELRLVVASNLITLRQKAGMTQAELGEKLNYSDKTVSKWERGESAPDVFVMKQLAEIYGVTVDVLLSPADTWQEEQKKRKWEEREKERHFSSAAAILVAVMGIWTMAVAMFVVFWLILDTVFWIIFPCAFLASLITLLILNSVWNKGRHNMYIIMALTAVIVLVVYLFLLHHNPWQLFLILVPAEALVFLCFRVRKGFRRTH